MKFKIQLHIEDDQGDIKIEDVIQFDKRCDGLIGLSLLESKELLKELQKITVLQ